MRRIPDMAGRAAMGLAYLVFFIVAAHAVIFRKPLLILAFVITIALITFAMLSEPLSDSDMIAHFTAHRADFEALVKYVRQNGGACTRRTERCRNHPISRLMSEAGVDEIRYKGPKSRIEFIPSGRVKGSRTKMFVYSPDPVSPAPAVIDLHRDDVDEIAPALLCRPVREELRSLCDWYPRVNDLDVLLRYDGGKFWEAERPLDDHWSLYLLVIR